MPVVTSFLQSLRTFRTHLPIRKWPHSQQPHKRHQSGLTRPVFPASEGTQVPQVAAKRGSSFRTKLAIFSACHLIPLGGILVYYGVKSKQLENRYLQYITMRRAFDLAADGQSSSALLNVFFQQLDHILSQRDFRYVLVYGNVPHPSISENNQCIPNAGIVYEVPALQFVPRDTDKVFKRNSADDVRDHSPGVPGLLGYAQEACSTVIEQVNEALKSRVSLESNALQIHDPSLHQKTSAGVRATVLFLGRDLVVEIEGTTLALESKTSTSCCSILPACIKVHFPPSLSPDGEPSTIAVHRVGADTSWHIASRECTSLAVLRSMSTP